MSVTFKAFNEILERMVNYVLANPSVVPSSLQPGSVLLTMLEAAAMEDDEQYFQMSQLLDAFSILTATGENLDRRGAEYGLTRRQPSYSTVYVTVQDSKLVKTNTVFAVSASDTTLTVPSTTGFTVGNTVLIDPGTVLQEQRVISALSTAGAYGTIVLTVGLTRAHALDAVVTKANGATQKIIPAGLRVKVPASGGTPAISYTFQETGLLNAGHYESSLILAKAVLTGSSTKIGAGKLTAWENSPPFTGATLTNKKAATSGYDIESDDTFRGRIITSLQSLSRGTKTALKNALLGLTDATTGQQIKSVGIKEDFELDETIIYIDDGSGFTPIVVQSVTTTVASDITSGGGTVPVASSTSFPLNGYALIEPDDLSVAEVVKYISTSTNTLTMSGTLADNHVTGKDVMYVDAVSLGCEEDQNFFNTTYYPIEKGSLRLWTEVSGTLTERFADTDFHIYRGTGDIEFIDGLAEDTKVYASYNYYRGLLATAWKVLEGDEDDPITYPGVKAAGTHISVQAPVIKQISVKATLTVSNVGDIDSLSEAAKAVIEDYVSSLGIDGNLVRHEIVKRVMEIPGIVDMTLTEPTSNIKAREDELPSPYDADGNSLVVVG